MTSRLTRNGNIPRNIVCICFLRPAARISSLVGLLISDTSELNLLLLPLTSHFDGPTQPLSKYQLKSCNNPCRCMLLEILGTALTNST
jgi:hypothetical protein